MSLMLAAQDLCLTQSAISRQVHALDDLHGMKLFIRGYRLAVTLTASMGVSALWVLPRLIRLQQKHPDIDVRVAASNKNLDLRTEGWIWPFGIAGAPLRRTLARGLTRGWRALQRLCRCNGTRLRTALESTSDVVTEPCAARASTTRSRSCGSAKAQRTSSAR
jgi:DNA-binding transcriptional LysR family regulator